MSGRSTKYLAYTLCATLIYALCAGFRDNFGILLPYLSREKGLEYATISFVIALGQLLFGALQPVFGYMALKTSPRRVLFTGLGLMLAGLLLGVVAEGSLLLTLGLGVLLPCGTAAASFGILMSCILRVLEPKQAHTSAGFISAGIGLSILVLAPVIQTFAATFGVTSTLQALCVPVFLLVPCVLVLTRSWTRQTETAPQGQIDIGAFPMIEAAIHNPDYVRLTFGFFTCGFHMALIQTHLFSQLATFNMSEELASYALSVYGLGVVLGCVASGNCCRRFALHKILGLLYLSRCLWVGLLLVPLSNTALFGVILVLGLSGVATVPPTSALVGRIFGPLRMATLFGFTYLVHQIGAFSSAWAGGLCVRLTGGYSAIWCVDIVLCLLAGLACLAIRTNTATASCGQS